MLVLYQDVIFKVLLIVLFICLFGSISEDMMDEVDSWDPRY